MNAGVQLVIEAITGPLAIARRVARPFASPARRIWRLAGLRSRVSGRIPVSTQFDGPVHSHPGTRLDLGEHCRIGRDVFFESRDRGRITLGSHVRLNAGCTLVSYSALSIGDDTLVGEYVSIRDADHGSEPGTLIREQPHRTSPIRIGRDVWIARGTVILKGVTIGDGAIIGANSVVSRDIPPNTIAVGAPARVIRTRGPGEQVSEQVEH